MTPTPFENLSGNDLIVFEAFKLLRANWSSRYGVFQVTFPATLGELKILTGISLPTIMMSRNLLIQKKLILARGAGYFSIERDPLYAESVKKFSLPQIPKVSAPLQDGSHTKLQKANPGKTNKTSGRSREGERNLTSSEQETQAEKRVLVHSCLRALGVKESPQLVRMAMQRVTITYREGASPDILKEISRWGLSEFKRTRWHKLKDITYLWGARWSVHYSCSQEQVTMNDNIVDGIAEKAKRVARQVAQRSKDLNK